MINGGCGSFHLYAGRLILGISLLLAAAAVVGCAGTQQKRLGHTYLAAGDYDRAVQAAEQAVAQSPNNPEHLDLLSDAQTAAADFHFGQAKKLVQSRRPGAAMASLERALTYMPAHPEAIRLKMKVEESIAHCEALVIKSLEYAQQDQWEQALELASEACGVDEGNKPAADLFAHAKSSVVAGYLAEARIALDTGDYEKCLAECAKAERWDGANAFLLRIKRQAEVGKIADNSTGSDQAAASAEGHAPAVEIAPAVVKVKVEVEKPAPVSADTQSERGSAFVMVETGPSESAAASPPPPAPEANAPALITVEQPARPSGVSGATFWTSEVRSKSNDSRGARTIEIATQPPNTGNWQQHTAVQRVEPGANRPGSVTNARRGDDVRANTNATAAKAGLVNARVAASRPSPAGDRHLMVGIISRGDRRFKKSIAVMDGLVVRLRDTDSDPLDADLEIVAGKFKVSPNDVPVGGVVKIQGISQRKYKLTILWIDHDRDTVKFAIDRDD